MEHFAGLDVSVNETSVCIVDDTGKIVREVKVASEPDALLAILTNPTYHFKRIGLEAGPLSQWLFSALAEAGLPVICVETRHMKAGDGFLVPPETPHAGGAPGTAKTRVLITYVVEKGKPLASPA